MIPFWKKTVCVLMAMVFIFAPLTSHAGAIATLEVAASPVVTQKAYSNTVDTTQLTIKQVLEGLAWAAAKAAIQSITRSIVNWINNGFDGSPAFVTDLEQSLLGVADTAANYFISRVFNEVTSAVSDINLGLPDLPFRVSITNNARRNYYESTSEDAFLQRLRRESNCWNGRNAQSFFQGDFQNQGGWNSWFCALRDSNNPYGYQRILEGELNRRVSNARDTRETEINWGNGYLSWRTCRSTPAGGSSTGTTGTGSTATSLDGSDPTAKPNCTISNPGASIMDSFHLAKNSPIRTLELADSINEIVSALMSQLITQMLGPNGILGTSQASAGSGGRSYLDQATDPGNTNTNTNYDSVLGGGNGATTSTSLYITTSQLNAFETNWTKILEAGESASTTLNELIECEVGGLRTVLALKAEELLETEVVPAIERAKDALKRVVEVRELLEANAEAEDPTLLTQNLITQMDVAESSIEASENPQYGSTLYQRLKQINEDTQENLDVCRQ